MYLWQTKPDGLTGYMSGYISEQLPNSELRVIPNTGHLWILDHVPEVLETLVSFGHQENPF